MNKELSKRTQNMLKKRGIDISKYKPKNKRVEEQVSAHFQKSDLEDFGYYSAEIKYEYGDNYAILIHSYERLETQEELAKRLCDEYDSAEYQKNLADKKKQETIKAAEKLGMKFPKDE